MDEGPTSSDDATTASSGNTPAPAVRTPLYRASNAPRYGRQSLIKEIQGKENRKLICYVAGAAASMTRDDVLPLVDLFHTVPEGSNIDLMLQTPGGDVDAAEKMASMLRKRVGPESEFRVIVPDYAKSAGTLIALASDTILMSDSSELGPVDPQLPLPDGSGRANLRPVQSYVDGHDALVELVNQEPNAAGYRLMLDKYDPTTIDLCRKVLERSTRLAEELLKGGMFRPPRGGNFTGVARDLSDNKKWLWHGAPIDHKEAERLGLAVTYLAPRDPNWEQYWNLYCEQRLALNDSNTAKLFESDYVSLVIG
ncbi:MAG: hypothetical protein H0W25_17865 [Acidimicrobiia bacterium]|nr:hypothetical protein [Acidimicrobiia bacterium]